MASSFTTNKHLEEPAPGDYVNAWATPVNANFTAIDSALGGTTSISVTGVPSGTVGLSLSQYQPPNIKFTGVLGGNLNYQIPTGVGGYWSISNGTSGAFSLSFSINAGNSITLGAGRSLLVSDGAVLSYAFTNAGGLTLSAIPGTLLNSQLVSSNVTQFQGALSIGAGQISGGTISNSVLPNVGLMPGVTIAADPGTTPSGPPGAIFGYY